MSLGVYQKSYLAPVHTFYPYMVSSRNFYLKLFPREWRRLSGQVINPQKMAKNRVFFFDNLQTRHKVMWFLLVAPFLLVPRFNKQVVWWRLWGGKSDGPGRQQCRHNIQVKIFNIQYFKYSMPSQHKGQHFSLMRGIQSQSFVGNLSGFSSIEGTKVTTTTPQESGRASN